MFFQKRKMASEDNLHLLRTGIHATVEIGNGACVKFGAKVANIFGGKDMNAFAITLPDADSVENGDLWIADIAENATLQAPSGTRLRIPFLNQSDIKVEAGYPVRFRKLVMDDEFELGSDNFTDTIAPAAGKYAHATAASQKFTCENTKTGGHVIVVIDEKIGKTFGITPMDVFVCRVVAD